MSYRGAPLSIARTRGCPGQGSPPIVPQRGAGAAVPHLAVAPAAR